MNINIENLTARELRESFITTKELAYKWNLAVLTLERWRREGTGPKFFTKGRNVFYNIQDVENYEKTPTFKNGMEIRSKKSKKLKAVHRHI